jgi:hypothetical protein
VALVSETGLRRWIRLLASGTSQIGYLDWQMTAAAQIAEDAAVGGAEIVGRVGGVGRGQNAQGGVEVVARDGDVGLDLSRS